MTKLKKLRVYLAQFLEAWDQDIPFTQPYPCHTYMNLKDGDVFWVASKDEHAGLIPQVIPELNSDLREEVANYPDAYLEIPARTHGQHHDRLYKFTTFGDSDDPGPKADVQTSYIPSIGRWLRSVDSEEKREYRDFCYEEAKRESEEFLRSHGIDVEWIE